MASNHSRQQQSRDPGGSPIPRRRVEETLYDMASERRDYINARTTGVEIHSSSIHVRFHAAVLDAYMELQRYRDEDVITKKWGHARMWPAASGGWVTGVDALADWIHRTRPADEQKPGRRRGTTPSEQPDLLHPVYLLRASMILDHLAKALGISIDVERGNRPVAMLPDDLLDPQHDDTADGQEAVGDD